MRKPVPAVAASLFLLVAASRAIADGLPRNWPMPPSELEHHLENEQFRILEVKGAGGGVTGASRCKIELPGGEVVKVKWKAMPPRRLDGWNNAPRKELATYELQKFFLDENDYVVPTSEPYCVPIEAYRVINATPLASVKDTRCVLGIVSVWIDDVDAPKKFWDPKRFQSDPKFARSMADFNLLTYLVDHRDGRQGNLLVSKDAADPRVFAVDNGIAFDPFPWNFFVTNWNKIRVPWFNHTTIDRLRKVDRAKLDTLGVVAELAPDNDGILHVVAKGPNIDPTKGVRNAGGHVQFGLKKKEIDGLEKRIRKVLADVDAGRMPDR